MFSVLGETYCGMAPVSSFDNERRGRESLLTSQKGCARDHATWIYKNLLGKALHRGRNWLILKEKASWVQPSICCCYIDKAGIVTLTLMLETETVVSKVMEGTKSRISYHTTAVSRCSNLVADWSQDDNLISLYLYLAYPLRSLRIQHGSFSLPPFYLPSLYGRLGIERVIGSGSLTEHCGWMGIPNLS